MKTWLLYNKYFQTFFVNKVTNKFEPNLIFIELTISYSYRFYERKQNPNRISFLNIFEHLICLHLLINIAYLNVLRTWLTVSDIYNKQKKHMKTSRSTHEYRELRRINNNWKCVFFSSIITIESDIKTSYRRLIASFTTYINYWI